MKALGIFNLCAVLGAFLWFSFMGAPFICAVILGGPVLVVIDVIWLIVLAGARQSREQTELTGRSREQAELTGQQGPQGTVEVILVRHLKKAQARGMEDGEVERRLLRSGWTDLEIQKARRILDSREKC